jgi:hypothetical protein
MSFFFSPPVLDLLIQEKILLENDIELRQNQLKNTLKKIKFIETVMNPTISLSEIKLKGADYYVIKGSTQIIDHEGVKTRLSVFVGRKDEFVFGKEDDNAIIIAKDKMMKLIEKKFPNFIDMYLHML